MAEQYKLYYFNARGRAESIRLIFAAAGQKYEDFRFKGDEWAQFKSKSPNGKAPFLEIRNGTKVQFLAESVVIVRYLAKKFGLAGKNEFEVAEVEMFGDIATDFATENNKAHFEKDETKKKELQAKLTAEIIPAVLKLFDERIGKSGSGYLAASGLTWVDLYLMNILERLGDKRDAALENFRNLKAHDQKIRALPKIAEWLAKRPKTDM